jgi:hypothetical protein
MVNAEPLASADGVGDNVSNAGIVILNGMDSISPNYFELPAQTTPPFARLRVPHD